MNFNIKKFVAFALAGLLFSVLTVTAANAATPCTPRPGCSCKFLEAAENHANAVRVRDKAYHRQTVKQPDNSVGMNCFDHALVLSSRLGQIFSDTSPGAAFPPANLDIWDPTGALSKQVYDPSAGVGQNDATGQNKALSAQYGVVMGGEMTNYADDFVDSLSFWLGATALSYLNSFLSGLSGIFSSITGLVSSISAAFNTFMGYLNTIQNILDQLGAALPSAVLALVAAVQALWSTVQSFISSTINAIQSAINSAVQALVNLVQGIAGSLLQGLSSPGDDPCSRTKRLWNPSSIAGGNIFAGIFALGADLFRAIEGGGIEQGAPYFDFNSLVSGALKDPMNAAIDVSKALDLTDELSNTLNQPLLQAALTDLSAGGILNAPKAPGAGVIWQQIPAAAFSNAPPASATVQGALTAIINGM